MTIFEYMFFILIIILSICAIIQAPSWVFIGFLFIYIVSGLIYWFLDEPEVKVDK